MGALILALLIVAQVDPALPVIIDPCADDAVDRPALIDALSLELAPKPLRVVTTTTADRVMRIGCTDGAALRVDLADVSALVDLAAIAGEDRPRVIALAAAELDRVPGEPRWSAPTATVATPALAPPIAPARSNWGLSLRSDVRKLLGSSGGTLGIGILAEQRPSPFGLLFGGSLIGINADAKSRLGLEAKVGVAFVLFSLGPATCEGELLASGGIAGIAGGDLALFVAPTAGPIVRWALPDGLELLTSAGITLVPADSWLVQLGLGLAWTEI